MCTPASGPTTLREVDYALTLLSHGNSPTIKASVESFAEHVSPRPTRLIAILDGPGTLPPVEPLGSWTIDESAHSEGFCAATRRAWTHGANSGCEFVFHLEADFLFLRRVDLTQLAAVLENTRELAQMALLRQPVNDAERIAGGLVESRPGQFEKQDGGWLKQRSFLTTNPSLMRTEFMHRNPWPNYHEYCEGRFGIDLIKFGYSFGMWGDGEPWVDHIGVRDGHGY